MTQTPTQTQTRTPTQTRASTDSDAGRSAALRDPFAALATAGDTVGGIATGRGADAGTVLAIITGVDGPSYRPLGAAMAVLPGGERVGSLSSGCIEEDIVLHAREALVAGAPKVVLYGRGSPYIDITLPCGGGLEILLVPHPDRRVLGMLTRRQQAREASCLLIDCQSGAMRLAQDAGGETGKEGGVFRLRVQPEPFFYIFGKGPEASTFAGLVAAAGYPNMLLSPDRETLEVAARGNSLTRHLSGPLFPADIRPDRWSSVVLFFHDHEWEPPILAAALESDAFYIGAQGSRRARDARLEALREMGLQARVLARLKGPIGLVPSARDARTLAVSVLAEILGGAA